tara:strand:+ start:1288 stop:4155 length:2868 start_codon:yes stop_codon:yes gene_type:complete
MRDSYIIAIQHIAVAMDTRKGYRKMTHLKPILSFSFILLLVLLASSCSQSPTNAKVEVNKSPNDDREYQYLLLDNKLKMVLISDPEAEKSAASFAVFRGSLHDPDNRQGLAHFFEHMLFIGTEKYPEPDSFQNFINANGGGTNAYTASDHTNYFFDIKNSAFKEGLDRFAHFFINPLLSDEYVDREKNAVHSEYQMQKKEDSWRQFMTSKLAMNPEYAGSKFSIGSLDTLSGDVKEELKSFQMEQYSADQMGVVVLSNESIAEMRNWIEPLVRLIPNRELGDAPIDQEMLLSSELPITIYSKPIKNKYKVDYSFPIPSILNTTSVKPEQYITNLLGHEGSGSLHKLLNSYGWIESLSAGAGAIDRTNSSINVSISLTKEGSLHVPEITSLLFQYIEILEKQKPLEWLYNEQAVVANLAFEFQEKTGALQYVSRLAPNLQYYRPEEIITSSYLMNQFDAELISDLVSYLRRDNVLIEVISPEAPTENIEKWFEVPYTLKKNHIDLSLLQTDELFLPKANPFLPENLVLFDGDDKPIQQFDQNKNIRIWMDLDLEFATPKASIFLRINLENGLMTAEDRVFAHLYRGVVADALNETVYPAYLAGLRGQHSVSDSGYEIQITGFNDKQLTLLETILKNLRESPVDPDRFDVVKSNLVRNWLNSDKNYPYRQAINAVSEILISNRWPPRDLAIIAQNVTAEQLTDWRTRKLNKVSVDALLHGNVNQETKNDLETLLVDQLAINQVEPQKVEVEEIKESLLLELTIDHNDSSMVIYLQDKNDKIRSRATSTLAGQMISTPYFSDLRTNQQLGYVVSAGSRMMEDRNGLIFLVQSPAQGADHLEQATRSFIEDYLSKLESMEDSAFSQHKEGLINNLLQKDKNLTQRSRRYWSDLKKENLDFNTRELLAAEIDSLNISEIKTYLEEVATNLNDKRLLVYSRGKFNSVPSEGRRLSDSKVFK